VSEAADRAEANLPDVAVVDIDMPDLNGIEAAQRIAGIFGKSSSCLAWLS
jgi:CheY-like chemotaxis protein